MNNYKIKNRNNINLAVNVKIPTKPVGLAFVIHGLGGFKEQIHMLAMVDLFYKAGYTVVSHDAANTLGESGGKMEDATLTNYYKDFLDVIHWAKEQDFYVSPFIVSGHSLGGACSILYASQHPINVKGVIPVSSFIGGADYKNTLREKDLEEWERKGYKLEESKSKPGVTKRINWTFMEDALTHDLAKEASSITAPVLLIVGSEDTITRTKSLRIIENTVQGDVQLHVVQDMGHNPRSDEHIDELSKIIEHWLTEIE